MDSTTFFYAVRHMRWCQQQYFRTRAPGALRAARAAEKEIDAEIERVMAIIEQQHQQAIQSG